MKKTSLTILFTFFVAGCVTPVANNTNTLSTNNSSNTSLTLDNCASSIASDAPDFYKSYFKCVDIKVNNGNVQIKTQGLPPYKTYYYGKDNVNYAEFDTSRGSEYRGNPNKLIAQNVTFSIPIDPKPKENVVISNLTVDGKIGGENDYPMGTAGVALNSVLLFNPLAGPGDNIEDEKYTFDDFNAHPQQNGQYHYHTSTKGPLEVLKKLNLVTTSEPGKAEMELFGIMCDGTVIMGCTELDGTKPGTRSLDAQGGHIHSIKTKDEKVLFTNRYHTHICPTDSEFRHKFTPEVQYYDKCDITR